jgi:hypothetical protein
MRMFLIACACVMLCASCTSTVIREPIVASQPSWAGNSQNSGVLSVDDSGAIVTDGFVERYNALVRVYGNRFTPPVAEYDGITLDGGWWRIDNEHLVKMWQMNQWRKSGYE